MLYIPHADFRRYGLLRVREHPSNRTHTIIISILNQYSLCCLSSSFCTLYILRLVKYSPVVHSGHLKENNCSLHPVIQIWPQHLKTRLTTTSYLYVTDDLELSTFHFNSSY